MEYAHVILPLAVPHTLTYSIPEHLSDKVLSGMRVFVELGRKRYKAVVQSVSERAPAGFEIKPLLGVVDEEPMINSAQLMLWKWMANYYMCTIGEVMTAALPNGLRNEYKPRLETFVRLHPTIDTEEKLQEALQRLTRAKKQEALLIDILDIITVASAENHSWLTMEIPKRLLNHHSPAAFGACADKQIIELIRQEVSRLNPSVFTYKQMPSLSLVQKKARYALKEEFKRRNVVLLHGVTASGKTEIYIHLIAEQLRRDRQVLYLVPEIALTTQLIDRLEQIFGNNVAVYHSRYSDEERVEIYNNLRMPGAPSIIVGARSALFLPFRKLGLIIVDEEHDAGYKQSSPAPRYNARDAAIVLAAHLSIKVLLGTATPAIETYYNVQAGKYGIVQLEQRYYDVKLPRIEVLDTIRLRKKKQMHGLFSQPLITAIGEALAKEEQVILFQNRRGFSPFVQCAVCGYIPQCRQCSVSLTYHKHSNLLMCHYCGHTEPLTGVCPSCSSANVQTKGFGTEKIEEEIQLHFPAARLARLDLDTTRTKNSYKRILSDFEAGKKDILIGTQMVTKGLDFSKVNLVGILNADNLLNFPDFRSHERSFQLLTQVSGRAGRKSGEGLVMIQTAQPGNPVIQSVCGYDYPSFFEQQLIERKEFAFPPYARLIAVYFKHSNAGLLKQAVDVFKTEAGPVLCERLFGPFVPAVYRVQSKYITAFWVRTNRHDNLPDVKTFLLDAFVRLRARPGWSGLDIVADVDPQ